MHRNRLFVRIARIVTPLVMAAAIVSIVVASASSAGVSMRVSTDSAGVQGYSHSTVSSISADGRYVAFQSSAANLAYDSNGVSDILLKDTQTGQTTMVSSNAEGITGNGASGNPAISADGRFVAFESSASNLVSDDTNGLIDVYVKDLQNGQIGRVSTNSSGQQVTAYYHSHSPSISADGRFVAFLTIGNVAQGLAYTNGSTDVFVKDRQTGETSLVSSSSTGAIANHYSWDAAISGDGRYVAFSSTASNLVPGDTNSERDVFVKDRVTAETTRVSTDSDGLQGNGQTGWLQDNGTTDLSISADGRYVSFHSSASNLVYGDSNNLYDIFLKDRHSGDTTRVSTGSAGAQANGASTRHSSVSDDGRYVTFSSDASNLVAGDTNSLTDVFIKDLLTGQTGRVSTDAAGGQSGPGWEECFGDPYEDVPEDIYCIMHGGSVAPVISGNGSRVSFYSEATNLVAGDTNGSLDVFLAGNGLWISPDTCQSDKPALGLSQTSTYWASYAEYQSHILTVGISILNNGTGTSYNTRVVGAVNSMGVSNAGPAPVMLGNIAEGGTVSASLRYQLPADVTQFQTSIYGTASDICGTSHLYPGAMPGA